eukprot:CAMPEP_0201551868 /NCGR_PEP_ID=MMETSP0173_2-20130828/11525_1 /ASSEMBLY_ACC=CAM_ASM_000268 /TAXON_ID=218659 /ORGANISM="Vexillifera sp., Strain DIVA3 564/2" /LENGTH=130 /DNA_ID=CAMNT_0047962217 /DNA_START=63 /DNA_END=455 /DNA_ORIENTATION=+
MGPLRNHFKTCIVELREDTFVPSTPRDITYRYPDMEAGDSLSFSPPGFNNSEDPNMCEALNEESKQSDFYCDFRYDVPAGIVKNNGAAFDSMLEKLYRGETCMTYEEWRMLAGGCAIQLRGNGLGFPSGG